MAKYDEYKFFKNECFFAALCSSKCFGNPYPWYIGCKCKKPRGIKFTAFMWDIIYLYIENGRLDDSLFYRFVTGSLYLILYHKVLLKSAHILFLGRHQF